jgi:Tol biopolymer transport system component
MGTDDQTIWMVGNDGSDHERLIDRDRGLAFFPAWSPDGTGIAFGQNLEGEIAVHVLDLATGVTTWTAPGFQAVWLDDDTVLVAPWPA